MIATERADWDQQIFRSDLWLYRDDGKGGSLIQLTQSGHDSDPSGRPTAAGSPSSPSASRPPRKMTTPTPIPIRKGRDPPDLPDLAQRRRGLPVTQGEEEVHTFSWSADSQTIYFATRQPWSKTQKDDYKKEWKDVVQYRTAERGDTIFALDLSAALARHAAAPAKVKKKEGKTPKKNRISLPALAPSPPFRCASTA